MPIPPPLDIPSDELTPGNVIVQKYRIDRVLGKGGCGVVVAATHLALEQRVAIKFLRSDTKLSQETIARFLREAKAAALIRSEHVTRVFDFGTSDGGLPYIVMEHLDGEDLGAMIERGPLPIDDVVDYVLQACLALAEAHHAGIVHRDLKPGNLFLTHRADGTPLIKILDFGISKFTPKTPRGSNASWVTTNTIMGSPEYMSPEQMRSTRDVDHRADIWALGIVLYELVTGRAAFTADTLPQLFHAIEQGEPVAIRTLRPDAPELLVKAIDRCLRKKPEERFDDVGQLAEGLRLVATPGSQGMVDRIQTTLRGPVQRRLAVVTGPGFDGEEAAVPLERMRRASAPTVDGITTTPRLPKRTSRTGWAAGGAALAVIALVAWVTTTRQAAPPPEPPVVAAPPPEMPVAKAPPAPAPPPAPLPSTAPATPSIPADALPRAPEPSARPTTPARPARPVQAQPPVPTPAPPPAVVTSAPRAPAPPPPPPPAAKPSSGMPDYGDRK